MKVYAQVEACIDEIIARVGQDVRVAAPLGAGKPNHLLNALYRRAQRDPALRLSIYTALTLSRPKVDHQLLQRLMGPIVQRVFGNYPDLLYEDDRKRGALPPNVRVHEFFFQPGAYLGVPAAQRDYISTNYTYAARDMMDRGVNVLLMQVAKGVERDGEFDLSFSCNADLARDLAEDGAQRTAMLRVCQTNRNLPFTHGEAVVPHTWFDLMVDEPALDFTVFGPPSQAIDDVDALIGLYASTLVRDGGELQIGIGSLGDAVAYALRLRHCDNARYRAALGAVGADMRVGDLSARLGGHAPFSRGLFAATEMLADAYRHLWQAGLMTRRVYDDLPLQRLLNLGLITEEVTRDTLEQLCAAGAVRTPLSAGDLAYLQRFGVLLPSVALVDGMLRLPDGLEVIADLSAAPTLDALCQSGLGDRLRGGCSIHAAFILGPQALYRFLHELPPADRERISMRSVTRINQLYGHEAIDRLHRVDARFLNTAMMVTLSGATVSDGLANGQVVSGVGGQYNFVAMAHALPDGRSVIQLRSTRMHEGELRSNIVPSYGHTTIARHQRDLVVTEYGVAELRGKTDEEVIIALLQVADSRFQPELMAAAKAAGKLAPEFELAAGYRENLPRAMASALAGLRRQGLFPRYPFGTDLTEEEQRLVQALEQLKARLASPRGRLSALVRAGLQGSPTPAEMPYLRRMGLAAPRSARELSYQRLLTVELKALGHPGQG